MVQGSHALLKTNRGYRGLPRARAPFPKTLSGLGESCTPVINGLFPRLPAVCFGPSSSRRSSIEADKTPSARGLRTTPRSSSWWRRMLHSLPRSHFCGFGAHAFIAELGSLPAAEVWPAHGANAPRHLE